MLDSPYALKIGHESDTSVSVSWKFTLPPDVSLHDVTFDIRVESNAEAVAHYIPEYDQEPLRFVISNLKPSTAYSVSIRAECKLSAVEDSVPATAYFTTMNAGRSNSNHGINDSLRRKTVYWD